MNAFVSAKRVACRVAHQVAAREMHRNQRPSTYQKSLLIGALALLVAACGGSGGSSSGGVGAPPTLLLNDGEIIDAGSNIFTIPAGGGVANVVANLLRQGELQECQGQFGTVPVADTLIEACLTDQPSCAVDFIPGGDQIVVYPPPLYAPVGLEYQLSLIGRDGSVTDPINTVFCLDVGANLPPQPAADTYQIIYSNVLQQGGISYNERCEKQGNLAGVLANDDDDEHITNSCLQAELLELPQFASNRGSFRSSFGVDGSFRYEAFGDLPPVDSSGRQFDSFTYRVSDGVNPPSAPVRVEIVYTGENLPPLAEDDVFDVQEDSSGNILRVLDNDIDPDALPLSIRAINNGPGNGVANIRNGVLIDYQPAPDFNGTDQFTYTVVDSGGLTASGSVTVSVGAVNDAPEAVNDAVSTPENVALEIFVLGNDSDPEGDALSIVQIGVPANGTATDIGNGAILYTPIANFSGVDPFEYTITDSAGGTSTATVVVTVDLINVAPGANAGQDQTVEATSATGAVVTLDGTSSSDGDNDALTYTWTGSFGEVAGETVVLTLPLGVAEISLEVFDGLVSSTDTVTISIVDTTPPEITAPADAAFVSNGGSNPITSAQLGVATAVDSVDGAVTPTIDNAGPYPFGTTIVTWSATDSAGNTSTATQAVTVNDSGAPVVTAPADVSAVATGALTPVAIGTATATDSVDGVLTATADNTGPYPLGQTIVTWSATDSAGNTGTATQTVTITDGGAPVVTAPADVSAVATGALTPVAIGTATATDSVDGALTATADNTGPYPLGQTIVTWSATDSAGNTGTATQTVTITDGGAPVVTAPADVSAVATGALTPVAIGTATATDSVDGALTATADNTGPYPLGQTIVTWSATDSAGNTGTATQTVTITDGGAPVVTAPADVSAVATGALTPVAIGTATATDSVDGALTATADNTGPYPLGQTIVTWSATDSAGNTGTATQTVTITDGGAPVVTAPADVSAVATGELTPVAIGTATATDSVDGALTATADNTGPYPLGQTIVTWSATDSAGNTGTATQTVTITDGGAPVVTAPADVSAVATGELTPVAIGTATATDSVDGALTATADNTGPYPLGETIVTWSATDSAGNTGTDTQTVTVTAPLDSVPPVVTAPEDVSAVSTGELTVVAIGTATATDDVDGVLAATADNTGPYPLGDTIVTWSAEDAAGNIGTAIQTVTVTAPPDSDPPVVTAPADVSAFATGELTPVAIGAATAIDDVDGPVTAVADNTGPYPLGDTIVTWSAEDAAGNTGTATQTVTVTQAEDTEAPVVTAPADILVEATDLLTSVELGVATVTDNVDDQLEASVDQEGPFALGETQVTWTAVDSAGNTGTATQLVTVEDTTPPEVAAPEPITVVTSGDSADVELGTATALDLVDGTLVAVADQSGPFPVGTTEVTWSATDNSQNTGTAIQLVTVTSEGDVALAIASTAAQ